MGTFPSVQGCVCLVPTSLFPGAVAPLPVRGSVLIVQSLLDSPGHPYEAGERIRF